MSRALNIGLALSSAVFACVATALGTYIVVSKNPAPVYAAQQAAPVPGNWQYPQPQPMYPQPYPAPVSPSVAPAYAAQQAAPLPLAPQTSAAPQVSALGNPQIAPMIQQQLDQLRGIYIPAADGAPYDSKRTITVFFDPRCPYCKNLYQHIAGKVPSRWIPFAAIQPAEDPDMVARVATILEADAANPGAGSEMLRAYVTNGAGAVPPAPSRPEHASWFQENREAFVAVAQGSNLPSVGVPFVLIPQQDGTMVTHVGYSPGDEATIQSALARAG